MVRPTDIGDNDTPLGENPTDIKDPDVPLAEVPGLNSTDHYGYILGYTDKTVRPGANITRAEVATIFFRLMTDSFRTQNWSSSNAFSDVAAANWFNNGVSTAVKAGIITGYPNNTFGPNKSITRAEFATIAVRFLKSGSAPESGLKDISSHWAKDSINKAVAAGWIKGYSDGTFRPNQPITRAEAVTMINRMLGRTPHKDQMLPNMTVWTDNPSTAWYYADIQEATNSHNYNKTAANESWTQVLANRDWAALEKQWSNAASAPGGEVVGDQNNKNQTGDNANDDKNSGDNDQADGDKNDQDNKTDNDKKNDSDQTNGTDNSDKDKTQTNGNDSSDKNDTQKDNSGTTSGDKTQQNGAEKTTGNNAA